MQYIHAGHGAGTHKLIDVVGSSNIIMSSVNMGMSVSDPGDDVICNYSNKQVTGFDFTTFNDGGKAEPSVTVDWIVTPYNNP